MEANHKKANHINIAINVTFSLRKYIAVRKTISNLQNFTGTSTHRIYYEIHSKNTSSKQEVCWKVETSLQRKKLIGKSRSDLKRLESCCYDMNS